MHNQYSDNVLTVNLSAIIENYNILKKQSGTKVAAVVKANAYGLGVEKIAPALAKADCKIFFVATLDEAIFLRKILKDVFIGVFAGLQKNQPSAFIEHQLTPVLNSIEQVKLWSQHAVKINKKANAVIHIDTGMNRLGLSFSDAEQAINICQNSNVHIEYIISHLACADTPDHKLNAKQLAEITLINRKFPNIPMCFANSSGVFLGSNYKFDAVRTGIALYGINPTPDNKNPMRDVIKLTSKIIQIRKIDTKQTVGYGATYEVPAGTIIATLPIGYADGYFRCLGNKAFCAIDGVKVPVVGRVTMDLITIDVTALHDKLKVGDEVEIIGDTIKADDLAKWADTIGYEVLTNLGCRHKRVYIE